MNKISIVKEAAEKAAAAESDRTVHLLRKADRFAAGIIIVTGFQLLDAPTLLQLSSPWVRASCCLALATLSLSLFLSFYCMRLTGYTGYPRGDKLWDTLKSESVTDDAAEFAIIQLLLKTREQNAKLNDAKTGSLFLCGWLFFAGFLLVVSSQLLASAQS